MTTKTMVSPDGKGGGSSAGDGVRPGRRRAGPQRAWRFWFGHRRSNEPHPAQPSHEGETPAVDIVDQAEAFQTLRIDDVMTPRADIVALDISTPLVEVVRAFAEAELARMPVYRETLDDPVGVVHIKDIVKLLTPPQDASDFRPPWDEPVLHRLRREVLYVPASMRCADLLVRMRVARIHMALVIDEFGGTDGLVTLEDLVEAVVGDIDDEHDDEALPEIVIRPGGALEVDARAALEAVEQRLGASLEIEDFEEEVDTVAGLVSALAGRLPQRGEVILHPHGFEFEVIEADPRRIRRLRIRPPKAADDAEAPTLTSPDAA
jgi:CBS domain containing-hemolysin-like protein